MRLVESSFYSDVAVNVYIKVKALGLRPEGCTAAVEVLAGYLGCSKSSVERAITQLRSPAPDGITELPENTRRTKPGGTGTTARRRVRPLDDKERFIWVPVHASECLRPRELRAYAVVAYAVVQKLPLAEADIAAFLRHQSGERAGQPITAQSVGRIIGSIVEKGWMAVSRRAGFQGRHLFHVNDGRQSRTAVPSPHPESASPCTDDGSGPLTHDGSLAYREDHMIDRPDDEPPFPSAAGAPPVECASAGPARTAGPEDAVAPSALRADGSSQVRTVPAVPRTSTPVAFSRQTHAAVEPIRFLLKGLSGYVLRRVAGEIERQLSDGMTVDRIQARLTARLAGTTVSEIRDSGRWLLGVALPRWGCADPACESGVVWHTGQECRVCVEIRFLQARGLLERPRAGALPPAAPRPCCPSCERMHRPGGDGECLDCAEERIARSRPAPGLPPEDPAGSGASEHRCSGRDGRCTRSASLRGLCWRCLTGTPERRIPLPRRRFSLWDRSAPETG
ncbi:hypothetical protein ACH4E7_31015 [Kitasatospora sp. NPDC018058]|uniref:hypothetical protein n=1 Tax=Kitasatospora sp. NPDC018058 TaxID=3364025 RepID=UPI0037BE69BA